MEANSNNNNIINYIKYEYEIIIYAKQNNQDYYTIKALKEQISHDNIIFYDIETKENLIIIEKKYIIIRIINHIMNFIIILNIEEYVYILIK